MAVSCTCHTDHFTVYVNQSITLCAFGLYSIIHQLFFNKTGGKKRPEIGVVEMYNPNKLLPSLPPLKYFSEFVGFFSGIVEINTNLLCLTVTLLLNA